MEEPTLARRLLVGVVAAALAFGLAEGAIALWLGSYEGWGIFGMLAALPAVPLALVRPPARLVCLVLGLLLFATGFVTPGGPHDPAIFIPVIGLGVAWAAVLVEAVARLAGPAMRWTRKRTRR